MNMNKPENRYDPPCELSGTPHEHMGMNGAEIGEARLKDGRLWWNDEKYVTYVDPSPTRVYDVPLIISTTERRSKTKYSEAIYHGLEKFIENMRQEGYTDSELGFAQFMQRYIHDILTKL